MSEDTLAAYLRYEPELCSIIFDLVEDCNAYSKQLCHKRSIREALPYLGQHAEEFAGYLDASPREALDAAVRYACAQAGATYRPGILNDAYQLLLEHAPELEYANL